MSDTRTKVPMKIRRSGDRGHAQHGWLDTYHTFSFADYYDEENMGYRALRVLNDDRVQAGQGFGTHPHRDMEIITLVLDGELQHKDSMGNGSIIRPGDVQRMSAGTGVAHSEFNPSPTKPVHLLQIWIIPDKAGHRPSYEQKEFPLAERKGKLRLVASNDGRDGSVTIHQDARVSTGTFDKGERASYRLDVGRHAWVHVARGSVELEGVRLDAGDAAAIDLGAKDPAVTLEIVGRETGEVLVFDLA